MSPRVHHALQPRPTGPAPSPRPDPNDLDEAGWLARLLERDGEATQPERMARALLDRFGGLAAVVAADPEELRRATGLGTASFQEIGLLRRLAVLLIRSSVPPRPTIGSWSSLLAYVRVALADEPREQFRTLFLDKRNGLMRDEIRASGTVDHAPVYVVRVVDCYLALTAGRGVRHARDCAPAGGRP